MGADAIRLMGLCWLGMGAVLVALASAVAFNAPLRTSATATALALSLLLCADGWPEARLGLLANAVIALSLVAMRLGAIAERRQPPT